MLKGRTSFHVLIKFILPLSVHDNPTQCFTRTFPCSPNASSSGTERSLARGGHAALQLGGLPKSSPPPSVQSLPQTPHTKSVGDACAPAFPQICTDIRLLASLKELEEPFEKQQIGECCVETWEHREMPGGPQARVSSSARSMLGCPLYPEVFLPLLLLLYTDRLKCNAIQAEPYALRAVLQPGPSPNDPCHGPAADSICAVV